MGSLRTAALLSAGLLASCTGEVKVGTVDQPPTIIITEPTEGSIFSAGQGVIFKAQAQTEGKFTDLLHEWVTGNEVMCPSAVMPSDGIAQCAYTFPDAGDPTITVTVTDAQGQRGTATVGLVVEENTPPTIEILSPADGSSFNGSFVLSLNVNDLEDDPSELSIELSSSADGDIAVTENPDSQGLFEQVLTLSGGPHLLSAKVVDSLGKFSRDSIEVAVNSPPGAPVVSISPNPAGAGDTLTVDVDVPSTDPDGDAVTYTYFYQVDGQPFTWPASNNTIPGGTLAKGNYLEVDVVPNDGFIDGTKGFAAITIGNGVPSLSSCSIAPVSPTASDDLFAIPNGFIDPDGDADMSKYRWLKWDISSWVDTGVTGDLYSSSFTTTGDVLRVECTPSDGVDDGPPITSASVTILNAAPSMTACDIFPPDPDTTDDLTANPVGLLDPDGDVVTVGYTWFVNGILDAGETTAAYPSDKTTRSDVIRVECQPTDGAATGPKVDGETTIGNSSPSAPALTLTPDAPLTDDSLEVEVTTDAVDPDGDSITYRYYWVRDGQAYNNPTSPSSNNTLAPNILSRGEFWEVRVAAYDGVDEGTAESVSRTVGNQPPTASICQITPTIPGVTDDLAAEADGWNDAENDPEDYQFDWLIDYGNTGTLVPALSGDTLPATYTSLGDRVVLRCTPNDGFDSGEVLESGPVILGNSPPSASGCALTPSDPKTLTQLTAAPSGFSDPDSDPEGWRYEWYVNTAIDVTISQDQNFYPADKTEKGDEISVICIPFDGLYEGTGVASPTRAILNTPPTAPQIAITVPTGTNDYDFIAETLDQLDAVLLTESEDDDGDQITYTYFWRRDGTEYANPTYGSNNPTISAGVVQREEVWAVDVVPNDGEEDGATASTQTTIQNSPATATTCAITPSSPLSTEDLIATGGGWSDAENDAEDYQYTWYKLENSSWSPTGITGATFPASLTAKGEILKASCAPKDNVSCETDETGTCTPAIDSTQVIIQNAPPAITGCSLGPATPGALQNLTATPDGWDDNDGDDPGYAYTWYKNDAIDATVASTSDEYPFANTKKTDRIKVRCTPDDGQDQGQALESSEVTIVNTPPSIPAISISPSNPRSGERLEVILSQPSEDDDGDPISYRYYWERNGSSYPNGSLSNPFILENITSRSDFWSVTVRAFDDEAEGQGDVAQVAISNRPAEIQVVAISPTIPDTSSDIVVTPIGWYDYDGDPEDYKIQWYKATDAAAAFQFDPTVTDLTYPSALTERGNFLYAVLTPDDGTNDGTDVPSATIEILNSRPTAPEVEVDPFPPGPEDDLLCIHTNSTDNDPGDNISYEYEWRSTTSEIHPGQSLSKDETNLGEGWWCEVTPKDNIEDGFTGISNTVFIQDVDAPPPPIFDGLPAYQNEDTVTLTGTCDSSPDQCDDAGSIRLQCDDDPGFASPSDYSTDCNVNDTFAITLPSTVARGESIHCRARCYDGTNFSGWSSPESTEVCGLDVNADLAADYDTYEVGSDGDSPSSAISSFPSLTEGAAPVVITGNIIADEDEDWYLVNGIDDVGSDYSSGFDYYDFQARLTYGDDKYGILVYPNAGPYDPSTMECPANFLVGYSEYSDFAFDRGDAPHHATASPTNRCGPVGSASYNHCTDFTKGYWIRVLRTDGQFSCDPYILEISND